MRTIETALRKTSGRTTALPRLSQTPPAILAIRFASERKSSSVALPSEAPSSRGVMWTISVPIATWTVSGMPDRRAATSKLELEPGPAVFDHDIAEGRTQADARTRRAIAGQGEEVGCLAGEPERSGHQAGADVLAGPTGDRQFQVMDRRRAVQGQPVQDSSVDPVDQVRGAARLDDMPAQRGDDRRSGLMRPDDRVTEPFQSPTAK